MKRRNPHRPLFDRYPGLREKLPLIELATLPTPIQAPQQLAREIGVDNLLIKRDDLSAQLYGGNKVRKLEFLLADALAGDYGAVLTYGGAGSNHALATAIYAKQSGLDCHAILAREPATDAVAKKLLYHLDLGTRLESADTMPAIRAAAERIRASHGAVYEIPFGGSSWRGTAGFVNAGLELAGQVALGELSPPDFIYLAGGTLGTAAGLALGIRLCQLPICIVVVQVTPDTYAAPDLLARLLSDTNTELHHLDPQVPILDEPMQQVEMRKEFLGGGYAQVTDEGRVAVELLQQTLGMALDTTYTAKAMAALISDARAGRLDSRQVLFWNTYNSRPYPERIGDGSWRDLPKAFHRYFNS
jgi:D-cysteine desulfhydrase